MDPVLSYYNDILTDMETEMPQLGEGSEDQPESPYTSLLDTREGLEVLQEKINARSRLLFVYSCDNHGHGFM